MPRRSVVLGLLVAVLATSACSDDDSDDLASTTLPAGPASTDPITTSPLVTATAPAATTTSSPEPEMATVRLVSQNLLHGIACAPESERCRLADRVALFVRQLGEAGCPELVSVQEANQRMVDLLADGLPAICDGRYAVVWDDDPGLDREVVLSTVAVVDQRRIPLPGGFRSAWWVRAATDIGLVEFVTTHLASSSDDRPCDADTCPPPCTVDDRLNACQARVTLAAIDELAIASSVVVLGGDLNALVDEPTLDIVRSAGFTDTHLAAGNPECDEATGDECTSGRDDATLDDVTNPSSRQTERIDYLLVRENDRCDVVAPTGLFNGEPAEGDPTGLVHPADHTGVWATLSCTVDDDARAAAEATSTNTFPPQPTTTVAPGGGPPDALTEAAISEAFHALFDGTVTDIDLKLSYLEDAELLRDLFVASFEQFRELAAQSRVRIDAVTLSAPDRATVTFAILIDGSVVLGPQDGEAVLLDGTWLVSRRTYCNLSTQGAEVLPEPCR